MIAIQFFYSVFKLQAISACCMFLFSIFMFSENDLIARQSGIDTQLEKLLEDFDPEEFELSPEQIIEYIQDLASNPVNINRATLDDLLAIPFISFVNAQNIISYRDENPPFTSIDEITNVPGIGTVTFEKIRPFISVGSGGQQIKDLYLNPDYWTKNLQFESINRYQKTLETREGFRRKAADGGFTGSPGRYYQRFRIRSDHLSLNLTQEKDPGEPVQFPAKFDHNSWHIAALNNGLIKTIVAGDYSVSFGQGLILWNGGSFGKGRDVTRTQLRNSRDIRPYTSAQETNAFRGIAATIGNRFQVTGFYSNRYRTATVVDDQTVRMPQNSGLHRTLSERERRFNLNQKTYGGRVRLQ
ncbi:MAG: ComEA family DNA-binding protein, partial [Balneolaceae bacterium]